MTEPVILGEKRVDDDGMFFNPDIQRTFLSRFSRTTSVTGCGFEVEVGTTGYTEGNTKRGGRTYIRIKNDPGQGVYFRVKTERYNKRSIDDNSEYKDVVSGSKNWDDGGIEIVVGGDSGLDCISEALRFIADTLDEQTAASKNGKYVSGEYSKSENRIVYPCIVRKKGSENINKNMMELLDSYTQNM